MPKRFIGIEELAEYLDLSTNTLRSWIWLKKIPYSKIGRLVKFDLEKIENWLKKKEVQPHPIWQKEN